VAKVAVAGEHEFKPSENGKVENVLFRLFALILLLVTMKHSLLIATLD